MIDYQWKTLLATAKDLSSLYATGYGALNSMITHHSQGSLTAEELQLQTDLLNEQLEDRFNEMADEQRKATEAWLARSLADTPYAQSSAPGGIYQAPIDGEGNFISK